MVKIGGHNFDMLYNISALGQTQRLSLHTLECQSVLQTRTLKQVESRRMYGVSSIIGEGGCRKAAHTISYRGQALSTHLRVCKVMCGQLTSRQLSSS